MKLSLLIDQDLIDNTDLGLERQETSPLLRLVDGEIFLAWNGIFYAGRYKVKLFAVDRNWFDLVRTDNVDANRETGQAGHENTFHLHTHKKADIDNMADIGWRHSERTTP